MEVLPQTATSWWEVDCLRLCSRTSLRAVEPGGSTPTMLRILLLRRPPPYFAKGEFDGGFAANGNFMVGGGLPSLTLTHIASRCRTRWFDSNNAPHTPASPSSTSHLKNKKRTSMRCVMFLNGGGRWIRTTESAASRFTVCPL